MISFQYIESFWIVDIESVYGEGLELLHIGYSPPRASAAHMVGGVGAWMRMSLKSSLIVLTMGEYCLFVYPSGRC